MSRYAGTIELIDYLGLGTTPFPSIPSGTQQQLLQDCLDRAESAIDSYTRRNFVGTAGTMYYSRFAQRQMVGQAFYLETDLHTLSSLVLGNGQVVPTGASGSVWLEPRNAGPPYRILRLHSQYVYTWNTDQEMTVAGTWGYGTVPPDDIVQATVRYAAHLFRQKDAAGNAGMDIAGFPQAGEAQFPKGMPDDVRWLLAPYRSRSGGAV